MLPKFSVHGGIGSRLDLQSLALFVFCILTLSSPDIGARDLLIEVEGPDGELQDTLAAEECLLSPSSKYCLLSFKSFTNFLTSSHLQRSIPTDITSVKAVLKGHTYRLQSPLTIKWRGGRSGAVSIAISGQGNGVVLSGAAPLVASRPLQAQEYSLRLTAIAHNNVRVFQLSSATFNDRIYHSGRGFGNPVKPPKVSIYSHDKRLPLASWPDFGYAAIDYESSNAKSNKTLFSIKDKNTKLWRSEPNLQFLGFWYFDWASQMIPGKIAPNGEIQLAAPGSLYGILKGQRVRAINALSELDSKGEWYFDKENDSLLVWPFDSSATIEVAIAESVLNIIESKHVKISNVLIEKALGDAIVVEDSEDVVVHDATIRNSNRAFSVRGGSKVGLLKTVLYDFEEGAVDLQGGNRTTLTASGHFVEDSSISNFAVSDLTYRPAIYLSGVGQRIATNHIFKGPHSAIIFEGNNHLIERNEINDVVLLSSDSGAIYTGRDFTAQGTIIQGNFLHDIAPNINGFEVKGVYLDDQASGIKVFGNVFSRVSQAVFIGGGRDNRIINNIFYKSSPSIHLDSRGTSWQKEATLNERKDLKSRLRAVPYREGVWLDSYPNLSNILEDEFGSPKYNIACGNIFASSNPFNIVKDSAHGIKLLLNRELDNSFFVKPTRVPIGLFLDDFTLPSGVMPKCDE